MEKYKVLYDPEMNPIGVIDFPDELLPELLGGDYFDVSIYQYETENSPDGTPPKATATAKIRAFVLKTPGGDRAVLYTEDTEAVKALPIGFFSFQKRIVDSRDDFMFRKGCDAALKRLGFTVEDPVDELRSKKTH